MLRQAELWRVLGRRLTERLLRAGWIKPVDVNGAGIFYDKRKLHLALKRVQREGFLLDGHVRSQFRSETPKVRKRSIEDILEDLPLEKLLSE